MNRGPVDRLWGVSDLDAVFGSAERVVCPWPRAGWLKRDGDPRATVTAEMVAAPVWLSEVDPRRLRSSQGWMLRTHAEYYRTRRWELTGITSADREVESNRYPIVVADRRGRLVIAAGHHRALAALVEGRPLRCRLFPAAPDDAVALLPSVLHGRSTRMTHVIGTSAREAAALARAGHTVLCPDRRVAIETCLALSPTIERYRLPILDWEEAELATIRSIAWTWNGKQVDVTGRYTMCTTCGGLRSVPCPITHYREDRCECEPRPPDEPESSARPPEEREAALPCAPCHICGLEVTKGHHRRRSVVCGSCRPLVGAVDESAALEAWSRRRLVGRLRVLGFGPGHEIGLEEYLAACTAVGIDAAAGRAEWAAVHSR